MVSLCEVTSSTSYDSLKLPISENIIDTSLAWVWFTYKHLLIPRYIFNEICIDILCYGVNHWDIYISSTAHTMQNIRNYDPTTAKNAWSIRMQNRIWKANIVMSNCLSARKCGTCFANKYNLNTQTQKLKKNNEMQKEYKHTHSIQWEYPIPHSYMVSLPFRFSWQVFTESRYVPICNKDTCNDC